MSSDTTNQVEEKKANTTEVKDTNLADKFPTLAPLVEKLEKEKKAILDKSAPWREKRERLLKEIQPLEAKLREVDAKIKEIERPHLGKISNELGALAKAMGGRSMNG